jgi:hypothetical protein
VNDFDFDLDGRVDFELEIPSYRFELWLIVALLIGLLVVVVVK